MKHGAPPPAARRARETVDEIGRRLPLPRHEGDLRHAFRTRHIHRRGNPTSGRDRTRRPQGAAALAHDPIRPTRRDHALRRTTASRADAARDADRSQIVSLPSPIPSGAARVDAGSLDGQRRTQAANAARTTPADHTTDHVSAGSNFVLVVTGQHRRIGADHTSRPVKS